MNRNCSELEEEGEVGLERESIEGFASEEEGNGGQARVFRVGSRKKMSF